MATNHTTIAELDEMLKALEKLQAQATSRQHQFLAYLLDMARMEAVSLISQRRQDSQT